MDSPLMREIREQVLEEFDCAGGKGRGIVTFSSRPGVGYDSIGNVVTSGGNILATWMRPADSKKRAGYPIVTLTKKKVEKPVIIKEDPIAKRFPVDLTKGSVLCRNTRDQSRGIFHKDGFTLLAGSHIWKRDKEDLDLYGGTRKQLFDSGKIIRQGDDFVLNENVPCSSPSEAAAIIRGLSMNGWKYWSFNDEKKGWIKLNDAMRPTKKQKEVKIPIPNGPPRKQEFTRLESVFGKLETLPPIPTVLAAFKEVSPFPNKALVGSLPGSLESPYKPVIDVNPVIAPSVPTFSNSNKSVSYQADRGFQPKKAPNEVVDDKRQLVLSIPVDLYKEFRIAAITLEMPLEELFQTAWKKFREFRKSQIAA